MLQNTKKKQKLGIYTWALRGPSADVYYQT